MITPATYNIVEMTDGTYILTDRGYFNYYDDMWIDPEIYEWAEENNLVVSFADDLTLLFTTAEV